jgi:glycosyltransferase involved in cell wall biosynthesis
MSRRLRVLHYVPGFGLGGTERTAEIFCRYLDRTRFDPWVAGLLFQPPRGEAWKTSLLSQMGVERYAVRAKEWAGHNARLARFQSLLGKEKVLASGDWQVLRVKILESRPDILHVHYSGNSEPPIADKAISAQVPCIITTNVFSNANTSPRHDRVSKVLFVSNYLMGQAAWINHDPRCAVLYNPIEKPEATEDLRAELGLAKTDFVVGRVGRPADSIHHPIALQAYKEIETPHTVFLALAPSRSLLEQARNLGLKRFIPLEPTTDGHFLSRLYLTFDVLAHARRDGETFGCNIAEAMIHGKPVISHRSQQANAQEEIIGDTGFVCGEEDVDQYAAHLRRFRDDTPFRIERGALAKKRALEHFEAEKVTRSLEEVYNRAVCGQPLIDFRLYQ